MAKQIEIPPLNPSKIVTLPPPHKKKKKREKKVLHQGVESPDGTVRKVIKGQKGLQVVYVSAEGERWRARVGTMQDGENQGRILLNTAHRITASYLDNTDTKVGQKRCNNYLAHLFFMLVSMGMITTSERAAIFKEEFEDTFMAYADGLV